MQSIEETAAILNNPMPGDKIYLTPENVDLIVPELYPWWRSGRGYAENQLRWIKKMLQNPIRHADLRAVWDNYSPAGDSPRGWTISWNWAVRGLTEAQKQVLRNLPEMVEAFESGSGVITVPKIGEEHKPWEIAILQGDHPVVHMLCQIKYQPGMHTYCTAQGVTMPNLNTSWATITCDSCLDRGQQAGYIS